MKCNKKIFLLIVFGFTHTCLLSQNDTSINTITLRNYIYGGIGINFCDQLAEKIIDFGRYRTFYFVPSSFLHVSYGWAREVKNKMYDISIDAFYPLGTDSLEKELRGKIFKFNAQIGLKKHLFNSKWYYYCFMGWRVLYVKNFILEAFNPYTLFFPSSYVKNLFLYKDKKNTYGISVTIDGGSAIFLSLYYFLNYKSKDIPIYSYSNKRRLYYYLGIGTTYFNYLTNVGYKIYNNGPYVYIVNTNKTARVHILTTAFQFNFQYRNLLLRTSLFYPNYFQSSKNIRIISERGYHFNVFVNFSIGYTSQTNDKKFFYSLLYGINYLRGIVTMNNVDKPVKVISFNFSDEYNNSNINIGGGMGGLGQFNAAVGYHLNSQTSIEMEMGYNLFLKGYYVVVSQKGFYEKEEWFPINNFNVGIILKRKI